MIYLQGSGNRALLACEQLSVMEDLGNRFLAGLQVEI
jgi:hypothetical protein